MHTYNIRTLRLADADPLLRFELDNRAWFEQHIDARDDAFYTPDGVRAHIRQYLDAHANGTWHPCVLLDREGVLVGRANLKGICRQMDSAEVGYRVARHLTGNGLATRALQHLVELARSRWGLRRLEAYVTLDNAASARVLEKNGFVRAAHLMEMTVVNGTRMGGHQFKRELA